MMKKTGKPSKLRKNLALPKYKDGDLFDPTTIQWMKDQGSLCPFCRKGKLVQGPSASMATYFSCEHCASRVRVEYNRIEVIEIKEPPPKKP